MIDQRIYDGAINDIVRDDSLYHGLKDDEAQVLIAFAKNHLSSQIFKANSDANARIVAINEVMRLRAVFRLIVEKLGTWQTWDRLDVLRALVGLVVEVWGSEG